MANDGFIEFLSPNALAELKKASEIVDALALKIEKISNFKAPTTPGGVNSASKQIIDDLKAQEAQLKAINAELIREEKLKQQVLATETKQANATKANIAQREAQRKASLAQQQSDEKAARAAERSALANQRLNDAYGQLNKRRNEAARTLQNLIASETASNAEIRKAQREFDILNGKVKKADQAVGNFSRNVGNYKTALSGATQLMGAFGIATGLYLAVDIAKNIYETTKQLQSLDLALKMVSETQEIYGSNTNFVKSLSEKWGIEIKGLTEQFTQFYVNAKGKLSETDIKTTFEGIAKAGSLMGISIDKQNDAFYAFNQMLSKGTVQAEELKKQLGNALPGAIKAATMAYQELHPNLKVTEQMMLDQMKAGKLVSNEMVPAIIRAYQKLYGIENVTGIDTLISKQNRLANSWTEMVAAMSVSNSLTVAGRALAGMTNIAQGLLNVLTKILSTQEQINKRAMTTDYTVGQEQVASDIKTFGGATKESQITYAKELLKSDIEEYNFLVKKYNKLNKELGESNFPMFQYNLKAEIENVSKSMGYFQGRINALRENINPKVSTSTTGKGSDDIATKRQRERIRLNYEEVESLYNLRIARLKELQVLQKEITDNQDSPDYTRLEARKEYSRLAVEILDEQYKKEKALYKLKYKEDLDKANEIYLKNKKNGFDDVQNNEEWAKAIKDINDRYNNETELANINHSRAWKTLMYEDADFNEKIRKATFEKEEKLRKQTIEDINNLNDAINKSEQEKNLNVSNNEKLTLKTRQQAFQEYQHLALLQLQIEKQRETTGKETPAQLYLLNLKYKSLAEAINGLESPLDIANEKMKEFLDNATFETINKGLEDLGISSAKIFLDLDINGQSTFDKLLEGAKTFEEQMALTFQVVGDIYQDISNKMFEESNKRFENQKANLEKEKEIALAFAGDSDTAKAEIERQAEERRKQIARREFKAKKEQAIFNIAIDTSQAIMSTYAKLGFPAGLPLAIIMGALGLAQVALVNSQQIPAYKEGTENHSGGMMLVNDGSGSNYKETIQTPDGKIYQPKERNVLMNAPKGTKVFTHEQWKNNLDNMLLSNNINYSMPIINNNSALTESQVDRIVNTIANKQEAILNIDKNGWNTSIRNGHSTKQILNNQVTFGR